MAPSLLPRVAASLAALTTGLQLVPFQPSFTKTQLNNVHDKLNDIAERSWERGTQAQALTEYNWPTLSVFSKTFPPRINATYNGSDVLSIATETVQNKKPGTLPLTEDGSAADPASLGTVVLLANWTKTDLSDKRFSQAAGQQLQYLLEVAPKSDAGAISHRADQVQFWSDFIYMVPPFISYFGALQGGDSGRALGQVAYDQIALYRQALRTPESNLWKHIVQGTFQDNTHWSTGNAWAAAGMLRVHQALAHSDHAESFKPHRANLTEWIEEILDASWKFQTSSGALRNVIDDADTFEDTSGTALIAAVTYRMAVITNSTAAIENANRAHKFISENIDKDGWLLKTVDPMKFHEPSKDGEHSPEGQAFVLLLHAAWRDAVAFFGKRVSWDD